MFSVDLLTTQMLMAKRQSPSLRAAAQLWAVVVISLIIGGTSNVTWKALSTETVCGGDLGESGAPDVQTCLSNCAVDPRCHYATFTSPSSCSWSFNCTKTKQPNATSFFKNSSASPLGFYVSNVAKIPDSGLLKVISGIALNEAVQICSAMSNCTAFAFQSAASESVQSAVYFLNSEIAIAPDRLFSWWVYTKNSSVLPFCDATVSQNFMSAQRSNELVIEWTHCAGKNISALLHQVNYSSSIRIPNVNSSLKLLPLTVGAIPRDQVGQEWLLTITAGMNQQVLQSLPLVGVEFSCPQVDTWPATVAASNVSLNCWDVGALFASGVAHRSCSPHGSWEEPDLGACHNDWTQLELEMLDKTEAELSFVARWLKNESLFNYLDYFPGNKIYGERFSDVVPNGCTDGMTWIAGNNIGPAYRRMQFGRMALNQDCTHLLKTNWSVHINVDYQSDGQQIVNADANLKVNALTKQIALQSQSSELIAHTAALSYHGAPVFRTVWQLRKENECKAAVVRSCGSELQHGNSSSCLTCAKDHVLKLAVAHCLTEKNWADVVEFWCNCDTEDDCGGSKISTDSNAR